MDTAYWVGRSRVGFPHHSAVCGGRSSRGLLEAGVTTLEVCPRPYHELSLGKNNIFPQIEMSKVKSQKDFIHCLIFWGQAF